jgi:hypothetical protein
MERLGGTPSIMRLLSLLGLSVLLGAVDCGSRSRSADDVSPVPSARPAPVPAAVPLPTVDAGPPIPELPRAISLDGFAEGDRIADLAGLAVGDHMLLAWVTYYDEGSAAARRKKPARGGSRGPAAADPGKQGASIVVRAIDREGEALSQPKVISSKAVSFGGVALAQGTGRKNDIALAWVGKDGGVGQVFVTKLSESGDKQAQKMITHSKSGCSDVGLAAVAEGFVVAWLESKDEGTDLFAAKVGKDMSRVGAERRITETKGEASDVRVLSRGDELLVLWSEVRGEGEGGIAAARVMTADLAVRGDPVLVVTAPRHPRGLDLSRVGDGVEVAWIEDAPPAAADAGAPTRAMALARLDASARNPSGRSAVQAPGDPSSVALDCERVCRVVVPVAEHGELALYGFSYDLSQRPGTPRRFATFTGVSTEDTSPVLLKDWLFFAEDNLRGGGRIRKAKLAW